MIRVVFNQKGGVGKSSIATNLAAISAAKGFNTLLIDLDPQCNSSQYILGDEMPDTDKTIADYFDRSLKATALKRSPEHYITATGYDKFSIICASPELAELQTKLESKYKIFKFRDLIEKLTKDFERIYIDTPPAFNFYTLSALVAADSVLIPFDCDEFSRQALYTLIENINETSSDLNDKLRLEAIVINQFQARANQSIRIVDMLEQDQLPILQSRIGSSVKMKESHEVAQPLIYFAPSHKLTQQFVAVFDELEK